MPDRDLPHLTGGGRRALLRLLVLCFGPLVQVENPRRLAELDDPVIFVLNHSTAFEAIAVPAILIRARGGRIIHFMVDWMFLHIPVIGWMIRQSEPIPVYTKPARWRVGEGFRQTRRHHSPTHACLRLLDEGRSVGVFPEGTRNHNATTLLRGRSGVGELILSSAAPVLPVGLSFPAAGRLGRPPLLGRMTVRVGTPMRFLEARRIFKREPGSNQGSRPVTGASRELRRWVVDETMSALARLCAKSYPHRASSRLWPETGPHREYARTGGSS
jgi:1-acyl-sn-glycerol-3-phosphate acyltransferase